MVNVPRELGGKERHLLVVRSGELTAGRQQKVRKMTKTEVAKPKNTAVGAAYDYGEMAHEGFEGTTIRDLSIPFINLLQPMSPEVQDETVENAKPGDLLNSVTREIIKQPLVVIPLYREESWVEWVPRTKGGGLAGRHEPDSDIVKEAIKKNGGSRIPPKDAEGKRINFKSPDGNDLVETHYVYCLILDEDGENVESYCVLAFSSAKIKAYKDWITALFTQKGQPPIYANRAKVTSVKMKNDGGTFFVYGISPFKSTWRESLIVPDEAGMALLTEAKEFRSMIMEGLARPDFDSIATSNDDDTPSSGGKAATDDEDIPF